MLVRSLSNSLPRLIALGALLAGCVPRVSAQAGPVFSTQTAISGVTGSQFVVFLPIFNTGSVDADNVQVTFVTLGHTTPTNLALPVSENTWAAGDHAVLDLRFDSTAVSMGANYLLTVRGTYQVGTQTLGFALNRFVTITVPSESTLTVIQHWIVLDDVLDVANSLPGIDPAADNQTMLNYFRSRPGFIDSDIDAPSSSVWATFANGEELIIASDRDGLAASSSTSLLRSATTTNFTSGLSSPPLVRTLAAPSSAKTLSELPVSSSVSLRNTLPYPPFEDAILLHDITNMLVPQNYLVASPDVSVDLNGSLRTAGGDGVFYLTSHGGFHGRPPGIWDYGIWSSTKADAYMDMRLAADLLPSSPNLIHMTALLARFPGKKRVKEMHYAFTSNFVRKYFKPFSNSSFVYIDACGSDDPRESGGQNAQNLKQAFLDKNASVYAGWTATVGDGVATGSARLVFDRLSGANQFFKEVNFNQRPFDWQSVINNDIQEHNLGVDQGSGALLDFTINPTLTQDSQVFGLLAPSIDQVEVDESGTFDPPNNLLLTGIFGSDLATVTVGGDNPSPGTTATTGGAELATCLNAEPDLITCGDLSPSGNGSGGNVQVSVRGHNSNIARLTYWQGPFQFIAAGEDSLKQTVNFNIAFRQDIRLHRPVIHKPPIEPNSTPEFPIQAIFPVSTANYSCAGTAVYVTPLPGAITETFTWTGGGSLPLVQGRNAFFTDGFALGGGVASHTTLFLDLAAGTILKPGCQYTDVILATNGTTTLTSVLPVSTADFIGTLQVTLDPVSAAITPPNPPPSGAAPCLILIMNPCQATMNWSEITPLANTAPDPNSAR
jgi:hypothetical protein